ncbi:hypothetical protein [Hyphobacterium marinum]|uniref:Lipoprotein n=1 Tax=Hyphobacterium marinum TaxID=3116574 RepID=A0ABU7LYE8_9PROT|nr:hypothetical protein [Hyphobacterium sp. Y6023]MEE2566476.1 hypothetical protein [Hyphobacterium sp. Y6023]
MRLLLGAVLAGGLLAGCGQESGGDGQSRASSAIPDSVTEADIADNSARSTAELQPGPDAEDEVGYGLNRGLATGSGLRSDAENFLMSGEGVSVERNVDSADGEVLNADRVSMDYNSFVALYRQDARIESGARFTGQATLWTQRGTTAQVVLQLADFCSANGPDVSGETVTVGEVPETFTVNHTFSGEHDCVLLRITNVEPGGADIMMAEVGIIER